MPSLREQTPDPHDLLTEARRLLEERFGLKEFRPGQAEALGALLSGRDALLILPTGAGKSLVFQLASLLLPGPTVVVSPLIALMKDQEEALASIEIPSVFIESSRPEGELRGALDSLANGSSRLVYTTPESLTGRVLPQLLEGLPPSLLAVDEAHSISQWGHSFRPAYLRLRAAAERLGRPPVLALTATASPWVREDVIDKLGLRDPAVVVHGTDRPNLRSQRPWSGRRRSALGSSARSGPGERARRAPASQRPAGADGRLPGLGGAARVLREEPGRDDARLRRAC